MFHAKKRTTAKSFMFNVHSLFNRQDVTALFFHVVNVVENGQKSKSFLFEKNSPNTKTKRKASHKTCHKIGGIHGDFEEELIHGISIRVKS